MRDFLGIVIQVAYTNPMRHSHTQTHTHIYHIYNAVAIVFHIARFCGIWLITAKMADYASAIKI